MRTDILDLQERYPRLAEEFICLRDKLELPSMRKSFITGKDSKSTWEDQANRRYEAGKDLDELIIRIREQSGFEDFLLAPSKMEMQYAARFGPIVVINVSEFHCDAILIEQHEVRSLALSYLSAKNIKKQVQRGYLGNPEVLKWLWEIVTNPILDALGFTHPPSDDN